MKTTALTLTIALGLTCTFLVAAHAAEHTRDSLMTVQEKIAEEKAVLIDVREKSEWNRGHIEGAILLPISELKAGVSLESLQKKLPKKRILYTHCVIGKRALNATDYLTKHGYEVRPLKAGYKELLDAGFPKAEK
jgi:phage shock protein E